MNKQDSIEEARNTPLIMSIKNGLYGFAETLLKANADPNLTAGHDSMSALHYCVGLLGYDYQPNNDTFEETKQITSLIIKLLECGANPELKNKLGTTPLSLLSYQFDELDSYYFLHNTNLLSYFKHDPNEIANYLQLKKLATTTDEELERKYPHLFHLEKNYQNFNQQRNQLETLDDVDDNPDYINLIRENQSFLDFEAFSERVFTLATITEHYPLLDSKEKIANACDNSDGCIYSRPCSDFGHANGNDFFALISGVSWHHDNNDNLKEKLLTNRKAFFASSSGVNLVTELQERIATVKHQRIAKQFSTAKFKKELQQFSEDLKQDSSTSLKP